MDIEARLMEIIQELKRTDLTPEERKKLSEEKQIEIEYVLANMPVYESPCISKLCMICGKINCVNPYRGQACCTHCHNTLY